MNIDLKKIRVVSGIGCTGKVAEYLKFESFQVNNGKVIRFAAKLKSKNTDSKVVVFLNDTDFIASESDDFIGTCKKGVDLLLLYINNFIYRIFIEHRSLSKTPFVGNRIDNNTGSPLNIPHLAKLCGARYVARWTPLHARRLMYSITDALQKPGFSVIEVIAPCLMYYASNGRIGETLDRMRFFYENSVIKHGEPTDNLNINHSNKIIVGKFVDRVIDGQ